MAPPRPVRILIDYRPALKARSGVGEAVHHLATALADTAGTADQITVFSSSWRDRLDAADLPRMRIVDRRVPVTVLNAAWHRLGWPPVEALATGPFDVVHAPHPLLIPSRTGATVVTVHDLYFLDDPEHAEREIRRDYPALVRRHVHAADRVIVPSRYTAAQVHERLGVPLERISVCLHGAPPWATSPPAEADTRRHILFVGTLEARKNVGALLDAYERLLARRQDVPALVLAGRATPAAEPWLARLTRAPLAGRARHLGYVAPSDRRALYGTACVLVLPSLDEGFGLPVLEAMASGVPVVAARRGALPEVLGEAGVLVEPEDTEGIAAAVERIVSRRGYASRLADLGRARAAAFTWRATASAVRTAYEAAIETRRARAAGRRSRP